MRGGLTKRQKDAFEFVRKYIKENEHGPSYEEIMHGLELHSKAGVHRLVHALKERGVIDEIPKRGRSISLVQRKCPYCKAILP